MAGWLRARLRMPSPAMFVALGALTVALGGTAVAATNVASIVNIADPTTPANVAKVDTSGALRTGGYVATGTLPAGAIATSSAEPGEAPRVG